MLDFSTLEFANALNALDKALAEPKSDIVRDATIQRFEFCVELAWKTARRFMGTSSTAPKAVVREMAQSALIDDVAFWLKAIDQRNLSSHTYKEALAEAVFAFAREFAPAARQLLCKLDQT